MLYTRCTRVHITNVNYSYSNQVSSHKKKFIKIIEKHIHRNKFVYEILNQEHLVAIIKQVLIHEDVHFSQV